MSMPTWIRIQLVLTLSLATAIPASSAHAQAISAFKIGEDMRVVAKNRPKPSNTEALGSYAAFKWNLPGGNDLSVTASPETGRIVFIESDWGGDPASAASDVPGMTFGLTTLADIRKRFQSNGFGFKSNLGQATTEKLVSFNCYQVDSDPDLVVVFVTTLLTKDVPTVAGDPKPDPGKGHLEAVILSSLVYLKEIWGEDRVFDATYHPVPWK